MEDFLKLVGQKIRFIRKVRGLNQNQLAEKTNMDRSRISDIENGKVNMQLMTLKILMDALDIHPNDLFNFSEQAGKTDIKEKLYLIEEHISVLRERPLDEVQYVINTNRHFFKTIDASKEK